MSWAADACLTCFQTLWLAAQAKEANAEDENEQESQPHRFSNLALMHHKGPTSANVSRYWVLSCDVHSYTPSLRYRSVWLSYTCYPLESIPMSLCGAQSDQALDEDDQDYMEPVDQGAVVVVGSRNSDQTDHPNTTETHSRSSGKKSATMPQPSRPDGSLSPLTQSSVSSGSSFKLSSNLAGVGGEELPKVESLDDQIKSKMEQLKVFNMTTFKVCTSMAFRQGRS